MNTIPWDKNLVDKYNCNGPRYTSYPTALALSEDFTHDKMIKALKSDDKALSLYIHLPFCHQLCYYCGCNRVITRHQDKADRYLTALAEEMMLYEPFITHRGIKHLHLGGGTPTFLTESQLSRLMDLLKNHLNFDPANAGEVSIEIDPRSCNKEKLAHLRKLGFNRVSYGVQDFNQDVQIAINRVQPESMVRALVDESRRLGFDSVNLDLVYGLPHQTLENFAHSLDTVIDLDPDRISMFSYAHLPSRFAAQHKIPQHTLLQGADKQALLLEGIRRFTDAGYQFIGMDHFAKADDELAIAQREGRMQRNFQGYTTHGSDSLLGLGVSSISQVNGVIWQHDKELQPYYAAISQVRHPISKGVCLNDDDRLRAALIAQLICHFTLDTAEFARTWQIDFASYFAQALHTLTEYENDGLVEITPTRINVTPLGRLWVRMICAAFDAYLKQEQHRYSNVV